MCVFFLLYVYPHAHEIIGLVYKDRENDYVRSDTLCIVVNYTKINLTICCIHLFFNELYGSYKTSKKLFGWRWAACFRVQPNIDGAKDKVSPKSCVQSPLSSDLGLLGSNKAAK